LVYFLLLASKMSTAAADETTGKLIGAILDFLAHRPVHAVAISVSFGVYAFWAEQRIKTFKAEIRRLTEVRRLLMHGLQTQEMKALPVHNPSGYNDEDSE